MTKQRSKEENMKTNPVDPLVVARYAENGSLMSTLKSFGAFPEKLVCSFCVKILNGLDYLHSNDVSTTIWN